MNQSTTDMLQQLIGLQEIDTQIYHLKNELEDIPLLKQGLQSRFELQKQELQTADHALKELQIRQKDLENDIAAKDSQIERYKTQQNSVKTNQEYAALTSEINSAEADKSLNEDEVLKLMDEVESQKKLVDEQKAKAEQLESEFQSKVGELDAKASEIQTKLSELDSQRGQFLPNIDPEVLSQYEAILGKRDGIAVVPLEGYSCGGCSMSFPPQFVNEVKLKQELKYCESCIRIVYDPNE